VGANLHAPFVASGTAERRKIPHSSAVSWFHHSGGREKTDRHLWRMKSGTGRCSETFRFFRVFRPHLFNVVAAPPPPEQGIAHLVSESLGQSASEGMPPFRLSFVGGMGRPSRGRSPWARASTPAEQVYKEAGVSFLSPQGNGKLRLPCYLCDQHSSFRRFAGLSKVLFVPRGFGGGASSHRGSGTRRVNRPQAGCLRLVGWSTGGSGTETGFDPSSIRPRL